MPYPAKFDRPVNHSQTTFYLSWRVNSSFNAPIINYHLEFKELPHGQWISVNIPANSCDRQVNSPFQMVEFNQSYTLKGLEKGANYQVLNSCSFRSNLYMQYGV